MTQPALQANPPIDYTVAVWLGMPDDEVARGLAEGWIRRPPGAGEGEAPGAATGGTEPSPRAPQAAAVRTWIAALDPSLGEAGVAAMWEKAGADDATRCEVLGRFVSAALGLPPDAGPDGIEATLATLRGKSRILELDGRTAAELEALAGEHAGVRHALATHSRWAVTGDRRIDAFADPEGRFDRFDRDTGELQLSDAWLGDRARHASWLLAGADVPRATAGDGWRFIDREAGAVADVTVSGAEGGAIHQVVFARERGDVVSGGSTTDRMYGGSGDDVLRGRAGDDLLEGQRGDDVLLDGAGRDDLAGGDGDDELDGGAGHDRLDGGQGADELSGGRGRDLLRGGAGDDVYVFESGDGEDTIVDDDGRIVVDGSEAAGTMVRDGSRWHSADGQWVFEVDALASGRVLHMRSREGDDSIAIHGWQQGRFGITLDRLDPDGDAVASGSDDGSDGDSRGPASSRWVDASTLAVALEAWPGRAPPQHDAGATGPGVTVSDLAQALAEGADVDEGESGAQDAWSRESLRRGWSADEAFLLPVPELRLRSSA